MRFDKSSWHGRIRQIPNSNDKRTVQSKNIKVQTRGREQQVQAVSQIQKVHEECSFHGWSMSSQDVVAKCSQHGNAKICEHQYAYSHCRSISKPRIVSNAGENKASRHPGEFLVSIAVSYPQTRGLQVMHLQDLSDSASECSLSSIIRVSG